MSLFGPEPKPKESVFKLNDPSWRPYSPSVLNKYGITPNKLFYKEATSVGVLAARQSSTYAECAVSKGGIDYLHAAVVEGRISAGYLVLYNNFVVLAELPIAEVVKMLEGTPPRTDGQWDHIIGSITMVRPMCGRYLEVDGRIWTTMCRSNNFRGGGRAGGDGPFALL
jgi:hypothetical protein